MLFKLRWANDDVRERKEFVSGLGLEWDWIGEKEKKELEALDLLVMPGGNRGRGIGGGEEEGWFKVEWEKVPDLVEHRKILVRKGMAYVPAKEQMSMVVAEFGRRLEEAMEVRLLLSYLPSSIISLIQKKKIWHIMTILTDNLQFIFSLRLELFRVSMKTTVSLQF